MEKNPLNKGILTENSDGIGLVTPEMVRIRAEELALIAGRFISQPSSVDYAQAKRELTDEPEDDPRDTLLESVPQSEGWDRVPGATGHQVLNSPSEDEDDEGRSESAQLVEEGNREAGHDQMLQAAKAASRRDRATP